ncbi:MAG: HDOD domain-containing protein [Planctomycetota bacterium]
MSNILEKIDTIPTLPSIIERLNGVIYKPQTNAKEVAKILSMDPALTSKILRIVNSAFYGLPNRITSITHAIIMLGFNTVKNVAISSSVLDIFKRNAADINFLKEIWKHCIAVASCAKILSKHCGQVLTEEFFISGLLHDIGYIVLYVYQYEKFLEFIEKCKSSTEPPILVEKSIFGYDHQEIGGYLFKKWNMPKILEESASYHHIPLLAQEHNFTVSIVSVADNLAKALSLGNSGSIFTESLPPELVDALNLNALNWELILNDILREYNAALVFMEML